MRSPTAIVAAMALSVGTAVALQCAGQASRVQASPSSVLVVDTAPEALGALRRAGVHGRVLVSFSRYLHTTGRDEKDLDADYPLPLRLPLDRWARDVEDRDLLWVVQQLGLARKLVHVVPAVEFPGRAASFDVPPDQLNPGELLEVHDGWLFRSFAGNEQRIVSATPLVDEPVVVLVHASYLDTAPGRVGALLPANSDLVVLCRGTDNTLVSEVQRSALDELARELGAR